MPQKHKYLDPQTLSKIPNMELRAKLVVEGFLIGIHPSPFHGFNVEFAEHRPYIPGDDIKFIDWRVWGKTDRFYIKKFEEETNLKCYILLDASASMRYTSNSMSKYDYGSYLTACLSYLMTKQRDSTSLTIFDEEIREYIPPQMSPAHFYRILKILEESEPSQKTKISNTLHQLADRINRRGLIILISDLLDKPANVLSGLKHFRHKKHEVIVFHLLDDNEINFNFKSPTKFHDLETHQSIEAEPMNLKSAYLKHFKTFIDDYKRGCFESKIDYNLINTKMPLDIALRGYLEKRHKSK